VSRPLLSPLERPLYTNSAGQWSRMILPIIVNDDSAHADQYKPTIQWRRERGTVACEDELLMMQFRTFGGIHISFQTWDAIHLPKKVWWIMDVHVLMS